MDIASAAPMTDAPQEAEVLDLHPEWVDPTSDYFAAKPAVELARILKQKIVLWRTAREPLAYRARKNWFTYYNQDNGRAQWGDDLYTEGEMGELVRLRVNIARNLVQHILVNTCSVKPTIDPLAKNTDGASTKAVTIGRSIATEIMEHKGGYRAANKATEYAEVLDAGYIEGVWDDSAGEVINVSTDGKPMRAGEPSFRVLSPLDVFFDLASESDEALPFRITRGWENRFDLIADFPELKPEILAAKRKGSVSEATTSELPSPLGEEPPETDLIEVFTFYHDKTPAMPLGRKFRFLADGHPLDDDQLRYKTIPVWRVTSGEVIGTAFGYGPITSLGSSQEAFNKMLSVAATTLFTHGVSNIAVAKGTNMEASDFGGGQKLFEVDVPAGRAVADVIAPINLTQLPKEVLEFAELLNSLAEQDAGLNKIVRGDPGAVTAGVAMSLYQAMAQQFSGPLEESRAEVIKSMVLWSWEALRVHSSEVERWVQLVGKGNREALVKFVAGQDLAGMERLEVSLGNPLSRTPTGRVQVLQLLMQGGQPLPPQLISDVLNTGNLDVAAGPDSDEQDWIRAENEMMLDGITPPVVLGQDDALHIFHHAVVSFSSAIQDPAVKAALEAHNQMHLQKMSTGDMVLLARRGVLQQGFANPMFAAPAPAGPGGQDPHAQGAKGKEGSAPPTQNGPGHAPPPKKATAPGVQAPPNPVPIPPVPGASPQQ